MAVVAVKDIEVSFEEAMSWLPSHVPDEAMSRLPSHVPDEAMSRLPSHVPDEAIFETKRRKEDVNNHYHRHRSKLPTESFSPQSKSGWRRHDQKPRNWAPGGGGMQAIFLDSGKKSTGTGVFLPQTQRAGPNNNHHSTRRPACSPVLLPSRVVKALNLNVHELGLQISPRPDFKKNNNNSTRGGDLNNKNGKDVSTKRCVNANENSSTTDILLPDEWTY